jgi:hypothetical protein
MTLRRVDPLLRAIPTTWGAPWRDVSQRYYLTDSASTVCGPGVNCLSSELIRSRSGLTATNSSQGCIRCFTSRTHVPVHSEKAKACSRLESGHIRCESPQMRKCDFCHHSIFVFFCGVLPHCVKSVRTLDLGLFVDGWTLINWLVLILDFRDPESANLVLQGRTFESQPFGGSPLACNSSCRRS